MQLKSIAPFFFLLSLARCVFALLNKRGMRAEPACVGGRRSRVSEAVAERGFFRRACLQMFIYFAKKKRGKKLEAGHEKQ